MKIPMMWYISLACAILDIFIIFFTYSWGDYIFTIIFTVWLIWWIFTTVRMVTTLKKQEKLSEELNVHKY